VISLFSWKGKSDQFRRRWRGYDPAEVDEFVRQMNTDRQRLEEDLAQLEAFTAAHREERRREFERLTKLRIDVASCLDNSIGALRTASDLLTHAQLQPPRQGDHQAAGRTDRSKSKRSAIRFPWEKMPQLTRRQKQVLAASVFLLTSVTVTLAYRSRTPKVPVKTAAAPAAMSVIANSGNKAEPALPAVAQRPPGLVLTLTAKRPCWIGTHIDGGQPLERMLSRDETIMLRANTEAIIRIGDASALSLLINNRPAKPLGASGEVVTTRITPGNYLSLLAND
jgi:DivIVA domain-containing protein